MPWRAIDIDERDGVALDAGDVVLPRCHRNELAVRAHRDAKRSGLDRNAWRDLDDGSAREGLVEVHDGNVMGAAIAGHEITLAITATADGDELRVRPAPKARDGPWKA